MDKPHLLIVEDDLDLSEMIGSYFRVLNYEVLTAAWASEALKIADETRLSLIMLDIRLPDIDGFELCRQLRENRKTQDVPILFLTEKRDRVDKLHGLELGVVDYITKPFDIQELGLRVRNAITRSNQPTQTNPITDLPEGALVDEKLSELLTRGDDWGVVCFAVPTIAKHRERYGFVAADDVVRALKLMLVNALREYGNEEKDFIGHLSSSDFVILTNGEAADEILDRVNRRIAQSREYFYPIKDREQIRNATQPDDLRFVSTAVKRGQGNVTTLDGLKQLLTDANA